MDVGLALWLLVWACFLACVVLAALVAIGILGMIWWGVRVAVSAVIPQRWRQVHA